MTARELGDKLDMYIQNNHGDDEVVIMCEEPSVAVVASEEVQCVGPGIDWNRGKMFIMTANPLIHKEKDRDLPKVAVQICAADGKTRPVLHCPACCSKIKKDMRYCPACGQRVDTENRLIRKM